MKSFYRTHLMVSILIFSACATFASKDEYWLYRQIMETKNITARAEFYKQYISRYPSGRYLKKIKDVEQEIEFAIYNETGQDKSKIVKYLELFPNGRFTADAKDKLAQLDAIEKMKQIEAEKIKKMKEEEVAAQEAKRKKYISDITGAITDWISISRSTFVYGLTVTELAKISPKFKELWSSEPLAECGTEACTKSYELGYHFQVVGGTRVDRTIRMVIKVVFREGKIWGFSVHFPTRGFLALRELMENTPIENTQEETQNALVFATEIFKSAIEQMVPSAKEFSLEGTTLAYQSEGANYYLMRKVSDNSGITDSLLIQLVPPPPPAPPEEAKPLKGKKKVKKEPPPPPPPPLVPIEKLELAPPAFVTPPQPSVLQPPPEEKPLPAPPTQPTPPPPGPPPLPPNPNPQ